MRARASGREREKGKRTQFADTFTLNVSMEISKEIQHKTGREKENLNIVKVLRRLNNIKLAKRWPENEASIREFRSWNVDKLLIQIIEKAEINCQFFLRWYFDRIIPLTHSALQWRRCFLLLNCWGIFFTFFSSRPHYSRIAINFVRISLAVSEEREEKRNTDVEINKLVRKMSHMNHTCHIRNRINILQSIKHQIHQAFVAISARLTFSYRWAMIRLSPCKW